MRPEKNSAEESLAWYPLVTGPLDREGSADGSFTGVDVMRAIALARLLLPAGARIIAPLATLGPKLAQVALDFGATGLGYVAMDGHAASNPLMAEASVLDELLGSCLPTALNSDDSSTDQITGDRMNIDPKLHEIAEKVEAGVQLSFDDGILLSTHPDVLTVGQIANILRERLHGNVTYYNRNLHLNATNICEASCTLYSSHRLKEGMPSTIR